MCHIGAPWLEWYVACLGRAVHSSLETLNGILNKTVFWREYQAMWVDLSTLDKKEGNRKLFDFLVSPLLDKALLLNPVYRGCRLSVKSRELNSLSTIERFYTSVILIAIAGSCVCKGENVVNRGTRM